MLNVPVIREPGRPSDAEVAEKPVQPAEIVHIQIKALVCPCCKRGMTPRVVKTLEVNKRKLECSLCGGKFIATYEKNQPATVRAL